MKPWFLILLFAFLTPLTSFFAQNNAKEWVLTEKGSGKVRKLKLGQSIQIVCRGMNKEIIKGKLMAITADSLTLSSHKIRNSFSKTDIEKISSRRKVNVFSWVLGIAMILVGFVVTGGVIALLSIHGSGTVNDFGEGARIMLPFLLIGILGLALIFPRQKVINNPFSENWTIKEIPTKTINTP